VPFTTATDALGLHNTSLALAELRLISFIQEEVSQQDGHRTRPAARVTEWKLWTVICAKTHSLKLIAGFRLEYLVVLDSMRDDIMLCFVFDGPRVRRKPSYGQSRAGATARNIARCRQSCTGRAGSMRDPF
jgi:hypothetical protein